jgi:hypothetical protein
MLVNIRVHGVTLLKTVFFIHNKIWENSLNMLTTDRFYLYVSKPVLSCFHSEMLKKRHVTKQALTCWWTVAWLKETPTNSLTVDPRDSRIESHLQLVTNLCPDLSGYSLLSELRIMYVCVCVCVCKKNQQHNKFEYSVCLGGTPDP